MSIIVPVVPVHIVTLSRENQCQAKQASSKCAQGIKLFSNLGLCESANSSDAADVSPN